MKQSMINKTTIYGRVYEHSLEIKTVKNQQSSNFGKPFLSGELKIATDEKGVNIVPVHYTYVTEFTKAGKKNSLFAALTKIMEEGKCWITDGKDEAVKVKATPSIALNDFFVQEDELVSQIRNEGGFLEILNALPGDENEEALRTEFKTDIFINSFRVVEADEERNIPEPYGEVRGAVFNFRKEILPVTFIARNPAGIKFFENFDISPANPIFTCVWGRIVSKVIKEKRETPTAFGEVSVDYVERRVKEYLITGSNPTPYDFGDEKFLTGEEVTQAMQNREVMLAEKKQQRAEWEANRNAETNTPSNPSGVGGFMNPAGGAVPSGTFTF